MFLVGLISWWYGRGWTQQWKQIAGRFAATIEFFSIGQLTATLFSPFRQISAGGGDGSFGGAVRAFADQMISRCIGAFVRFCTILIGVVAIILQALYELVIMVAWWFVPLLPIIGAIMMAIGWVPIWM
ncbi:hypothetical protein BGO18_03960 [Candidatus Saccharibacteria bacterium 47-87]|nr:hypothetical protein [Candidatus Saccharibacteria bacterium]OJU97289.1 MAG: hypothetical protein BGO18_03960 [Candidatus Saccharibacteria bacterium 47-87]